MDQVQQQDRRPSGRGALAWAAFVLVALLLTAAAIAGAIRGLSPSAPSGALPLASGPPSPAPTPVPRPGPAPPRTEQASLTDR
jgi:hypothetical protein